MLCALYIIRLSAPCVVQKGTFATFEITGISLNDSEAALGLKGFCYG
jgi:hypothetical protein